MRIWFALLLAPVLLLTDQSVAYAMAGWACSKQQVLPMHALHLAFAAVTLGATVAATGPWRATAGSTDATIVRRHFVAGLAVASGAFSTLVILAMWIPNWVLSPCFG